MLTKDDILGASGLKIESVEAFGGTVYVREMNGAERDRMANMFADAAVNGEGRIPEGYKTLVALWCTCDEDGNSIFSKADLKALQSKSVSEISKIADKAMSLSEIEEDEEAEGN